MMNQSDRLARIEAMEDAIMGEGMTIMGAFRDKYNAIASFIADNLSIDIREIVPDAKGGGMMEMKPEMQRELKRLSELSAQLKDAEKQWAEVYTNRRNAEMIGAEPHVLIRYNDMAGGAAGRISILKNVIVEHVHLLAAQMDAQLHADGGDAT